MRRIFAGLIVCFACSSLAKNLTFECDPVPTDVVAYRFYERISADSTQFLGETPVPRLPTTSWTEGSHTVFVTALNDAGMESLPSDPLTFKLVRKTVALQTSSDMVNWTDFAVHDILFLDGDNRGYVNIEFR